MKFLSILDVNLSRLDLGATQIDSFRLSLREPLNIGCLCGCRHGPPEVPVSRPALVPASASRRHRLRRSGRPGHLLPGLQSLEMLLQQKDFRLRLQKVKPGLNTFKKMAPNFFTDDNFFCENKTFKTKILQRYDFSESDIYQCVCVQSLALPCLMGQHFLFPTGARCNVWKHST